MLGYKNLAGLKDIDVKDLYVKSKDRSEHLKRLDNTLISFAEFEIRCKDGTTIWCRDYPRANKGTTGEIDFYDGILVDITSQRKTEEKLRKALRQLARSNKEQKTMIAALEGLTLEDPLTGLYKRSTTRSPAGRPSSPSAPGLPATIPAVPVRSKSC